VSAFGDLVQALIGSDSGLANELDGSSPAPAPSVGSRPSAIASAHRWTAPDASGHGQFSVHRDVLRGVAAGMRSDLQDLDGAVTRLDGVRHGEGVSITANAGLIAGWPTAVAFNTNASAAFTGVVLASLQTRTAHQDTSSRVAINSANYEQSESDNLRAARSVGTNLYSVTGLVSSYGGGGRSAASALGTQPSYLVKTQPVAGFNGAGMSAGTIMEILRSLSPGEVAAAGAAHTHVGEVLDSVAGRLAANARTLAANWSGSAAQAAMGQFQQLHNHMVVLAQQARQVGSVLSWLGDKVLPQFTSLPDPRVSPASLVLHDAVTGTALDGVVGGLIGAGTGLLDELDGSAQATADRAARQYIAKLSGYLVIADQSLPSAIGATPAPARGNGGGAPPAVPVAGGAPSGAAGSDVRLLSGGSAVTLGGRRGRGGSMNRTGGVAGGARTPGRTGSATPPPSGLQGATIPGGQLPVPGGTTSSLSPAAPLPGPGGLSGGMPAPVPGLPGGTEPSLGQVAGTLDDTTVPVVGQAGESLPGGIAPEASGLVTGLADEPGSLPGLPGAGGDCAVGSPVAADVIGGQSLQLDGDGALAGAGEAAAAPDMAGLPMMAAGGAVPPEERERIRQGWLNDDLWRPSATLVPPVIGE
jgi:uncharacterized protein YukE